MAVPLRNSRRNGPSQHLDVSSAQPGRFLISDFQSSKFYCTQSAAGQGLRPEFFLPKRLHPTVQLCSPCAKALPLALQDGGQGPLRPVWRSGALSSTPVQTSEHPTPPLPADKAIKLLFYTQNSISKLQLGVRIGAAFLGTGLAFQPLRTWCFQRKHFQSANASKGNPKARLIQRIHLMYQSRHLGLKDQTEAAAIQNLISFPGETVLFLLLVALPLFPTGEAGKITGGHEAKPHSRPYMAFLQYKISGKSYRCGGFLVREDFVLTAAHCQGRSMKVTLGAHNTEKKERTQQVFQLRRAIPHPGYNKETYANDLMLLQLKRKAKVTTAVSTISLPSGSDTVNPGMLCSVAGWGLLRVEGSTTKKLQEVELEVQRDEECKSRYAVYDSSTQMCVGNPRMTNNAMEGDSGGPLVCNGVAQGIVSYGRDTPPDVYTRISRFQQWIKETMKMYKLQGPD
ncbi:mast cell protease 1A-like [Oryx dammah]|uniref:mast cell protease 1A-like n=1 Tax=Oryx dammah TaxID=59534 RepID=UPI001A9ABC80|nr:mast cell protease 1A-like [Oryx dammah]